MSVQQELSLSSDFDQPLRGLFADLLTPERGHWQITALAQNKG
jgi:hypothetical protein